MSAIRPSLTKSSSTMSRRTHSAATSRSLRPRRLPPSVRHFRRRKLPAGLSTTYSLGSLFCLLCTVDISFEMSMQHVADLSLLPSIRVAKGISLEQISEVTKISVAALEAIETGHFERLPGGVYNVNYIRQYAREIGVEESERLSHCRPRTPSPADSIVVDSGPPDRLRSFCNRIAELFLTRHREPRFAADQPARVTVI